MAAGRWFQGPQRLAIRVEQSVFCRSVGEVVGGLCVLRETRAGCVVYTIIYTFTTRRC